MKNNMFARNASSSFSHALSLSVKVHSAEKIRANARGRIDILECTRNLASVLEIGTFRLTNFHE